ncbi:MAG TPA: helix-turn-helix domain-containing protein [Balneolales bacterium]|nr:helix-turn-helix domain-containing protein [Balneolales bacterium]
MTRKKIRIIKNLAEFEKVVNRDKTPYDINMMVMPGTLQDKHKNVDPEKGIQALRRQFNLVYLILDGVHDVHLGAQYQWLKPNDLVIVPENTVYASTNVQNCIGYCIHFKTEYIRPFLNGPITSVFPYFNLDAEHIINISDNDSEMIQQAFRDIIKEYERTSPEKDYLLRNYIYILLLRIREIYRPYAREIKANLTRSEELANRFKHLVEKNIISMRRVQDYAEKLHISPNYLSNVVLETFGKSAKEIINDMLLLEIKVQLGATDKTVSEIAYSLNFTDQSHLNHFMKGHTGLTPLKYRELFDSNK